MPRETLIQVRAERDAARKSLGAYELAMHDLVQRPETITWVSAKHEDHSMEWGLLRLAGAHGGIVITKPKDAGVVTVIWLDDVLARLQQLEGAIGGTALYVTRLLAEHARRLRNKAIAAEIGQPRVTA